MRKLTLLFAFLAFLSWQVNAQTTISGTVTSSEDGAPLPGVSVMVKGTTLGIMTDFDGKYNLSGVPADATTLTFSFVGYTTQDVVIGGRTTINVVLKSATDIEEVVVTGFGIKREKRSVTYQTEKVGSEDLLAGQATTAAGGMVGKVAGLQINIQDNGVNPNSQILLRGLRSISGNNEALVVIDGAIASTSAFDDLNPNDIESINVLKGASAAAIYGSSAANGAMIVVTKSGQQGASFHFGVNSSATFEEVSYMPDFQTEHGTGWDGVYNNIENTNWGPRFDGQVRQIGPTFEDGTYQAVPYAPIKDNLKDFYQRGFTLQNTVYLTGGSKDGSFYMSFGNQDVSGIIPDDTYSRNTVKVNASKKIGDVELKVNTSYLSDETDVVGSNIGDQDRPIYWFVLNTPANIPLSSYKDWDDPTSFGYADNYYNAFYQNPYWAVGTNRNNDKTRRFIGNVSGAWDIASNVNFTARLGINQIGGIGKDWRAYQDYDPVLQPYHSTVSSYVEDTEYEAVTYTGDAILTSEFELTSDLKLKAILGASIYSYDYRYSYIRANNLSIPDFYDISNGTGQLVGTVNAEQKRTIGFFGDFSLGFRNWAFLTLTGRQDYTSTLPIGENGYFYPAVGLSAVLTDAIPALQNNDILTFAKITATNSTVYNDLTPYQINERFYQSSAFPYGDINGFYQADEAVDSDIKKEKMNATEFGINLGFFKGRLNLDASYFMNVTTDLITSTTPSYSSGATAYLTNIGRLDGSGVEVTLSGTILKLGDFAWNANLNFYQYETIVTEIKDDLKEIALDAYTGYGTYAVVGEAFPQLKAVSYVRDNQGRIVINPNDGNPIVGDLKNQGKTTPDYVIGYVNQFSFKGVTLSATLDFRADYVYYAQGSDAMEFTGRSMESVSSNRTDFVWPNSVYLNENDVYVENTNIQTTGATMEFWQNRYNEIKENYVKDATAFKIRELGISYQLPQSVIDATKVLNKVSVGFVARNLWTYLPYQKYKFSDPEFRNTRSTDDANGIGIGGYFNPPPTRSYGFNLSIEF